MSPIRRLLIANRGEIACRIIRTARTLGIHTIAVYSEADEGALHTTLADEAWPIGPAAARESYLDGEKILAVARAARADAVHPGYGFLSENDRFAERLEQEGLIFVGPPASAIRAMGDKAGAKALMAAAGLPLMPGYHGEDQSEATLLAEARHIPLPLLIKAAAGGGGKGMRRVDRLEDLCEALASVRREAASAFGDERVLLERYLERARHVEVQIFADRHGHAIYLGDRDCSLQRRHQKVIEEAPAPSLPDSLRQAMGEASVAAALAIGYVGAGTMEFLVSGDDFYFMEMNTRLQVEHPVTECVTGLDLVAWQLGVAQGDPLPLTQEQVRLTGHAVEARLYAEDVAAGFLPASGPIECLTWPDGVRIDTGVRAGDIISPHYDPMIAKLIAHGRDRADALARLACALDALTLTPLSHNGPLLARLCRDPDVLTMAHHTQWPLPTADAAPPEIAWLAAALLLMPQAGDRDPWLQFRGFRLGGFQELQLTLQLGEMRRTLTLTFDRRSHVAWQGQWIPWRREDSQLQLFIGGHWCTMGWRGAALHLEGAAYPFLLCHPDLDPVEAEAAHGAIAPMHAMVVEVLVRTGERVAKGQPLVVLEAMKMEHTLRAPEEGQVAAIHCAHGDQVSQGMTLVSFEET